MCSAWAFFYYYYIIRIPTSTSYYYYIFRISLPSLLPVMAVMAVILFKSGRFRFRTDYVSVSVLAPAVLGSPQ